MNRPAPLSPETIAAILDALRTGRTVTSVATAHGVSWHRVARLRNRHDVPKRSRRTSNPSSADWKRAVAMVCEQGVTQRVAAAHIGVSRSGLQKHVARHRRP